MSSECVMRKRHRIVSLIVGGEIAGCQGKREDLIKWRVRVVNSPNSSYNFPKTARYTLNYQFINVISCY